MADEKGNRLEFFQVDAFTSEKFRGNPAAVVLPEDTLPDSLCLKIAAEMNLSETAFIHPVERKEDDIPRFGLRWFTPKTEVPLCGHATLATAKVIFKVIGIDSEVIAFDTKSGALFAHREGTSIRLDFPANPSEPSNAPDGLLDAMGITAHKDIEYSPGSRKLLVEVEGEDKVRSLEPDFRAMLSCKGPPDVLGVIVTSRAEGDLDFVSRFFAPRVGIDEDPVTGAAHTVLVPYWSKRLKKKVMSARQISPRGGELMVRLEGDRVHLTGEAVIVMDGTIYL
jgi:PhzF family phenazine biosynthesis protein